MYTSTLFKVIERHLPEAHCYADDTQLYVSFKPGEVNIQVVQEQNFKPFSPE